MPLLWSAFRVLDKMSGKIKQCCANEKEVSKSYFYVNNAYELFCISCLVPRNKEVSPVSHIRLLTTKLMFLENM